MDGDAAAGILTVERQHGLRRAGEGSAGAERENEGSEPGTLKRWERHAGSDGAAAEKFRGGWLPITESARGSPS